MTTKFSIQANVIALDNSTELVSEKEFAVYKSAEKAMKCGAKPDRGR